MTIASDASLPTTALRGGGRPAAPPRVRDDEQAAREPRRQALTGPNRAIATAADGRDGFAQHLREAIAVNRARRGYYAAQTGGRSRLLSTALVAMERLSLPWAMFLDRQARPFAARGIAVVGGDFVPLHGLPPADRPPRHRRVAGPAHVEPLKAALAAYRAEVKAALAAQDLLRVAAASHALLGTITRTEAAADAHFAMTRHIAESIGLAALNGARHAAVSGGATTGLSTWLIRGQLTALGSSLWMDGQAQAQHARGVGILVNDLPHIPFEAQWEAHTRRQAAPRP